MPSCAACDRYLSPATVRPDGTCPRCGRPVEVAAAARPERGEGVEGADGVGAAERTPIPWHFKVGVVALVIYLGWRFYEGIAWLGGKLIP